MREELMNVLNKGSFIDGKLKIEGSIRIDGGISGEIQATDKIIVGSTGQVNADVKSNHLSVSGKFNGSAIVQDTVELLKGAIFEGEITCKKLIVEEGVLLDGNINMKEKPKKIQKEEDV